MVLIKYNTDVSISNATRWQLQSEQSYIPPICDMTREIDELFYEFICEI